MQLHQNKSRKSIDDQEIGYKKQQSTRKSVGQTKLNRSVSKDKENHKAQTQLKTKTKNISETFKLKDILKRKEFYKGNEEYEDNTVTRSTPQKTECQTSNSRFSNCNCKQEIIDDNLNLKQEILEHLEKIQCIVQKNERFMTHRSQQEIKHESFINQDKSSRKCINKVSEQDQSENVPNTSNICNLNYIIQQQQFQISNLKTKLFCQEQKFLEKQSQYEQEVLQLKNQILQLTSGMDILKEQIHQQQFQRQVNIQTKK
ncbi:unnamed protein product [Paramecium pentaurelia]|uniref:Uncharacterized protein n=1 Tax=Paramecium pentaurelia TaxID=43138 RepID=A0A8S1T8I5_9CILI|nr:unnamed protein product [Paramecium pentaurelia]